MTTTFSKEQIEKELGALPAFSVAYIQSKFGLGYEKARALVTKLIEEKKVTPLDDGLSYTYETTLKKAQEKQRASSPFSRFFNNRRLVGDKLFEAELGILNALYTHFNVQLEQKLEPHSYTLEITSHVGAHYTFHLDLVSEVFRIHDGRAITELCEDDLELGTQRGVNLMCRILKEYPALSTLDDGSIGAENITADNAPNIVKQLFELSLLMGDVGTYQEAMLEHSLDELYRAVQQVVAYLTIKADSRSLSEVIESAEKAIHEEELDSTEQETACNLAISYLKEMSEFGFSTLASAVLNPRVKKFKLVPKD